MKAGATAGRKPCVWLLRWGVATRSVPCGQPCSYCAKLAAIENAEMLALDALENGAPEVWACLTTRSADPALEQLLPGPGAGSQSSPASVAGLPGFDSGRVHDRLRSAGRWATSPALERSAQRRSRRGRRAGARGHCPGLVRPG